jgi:hypothetical protein
VPLSPPWRGPRRRAGLHRWGGRGRCCGADAAVLSPTSSRALHDGAISSNAGTARAGNVKCRYLADCSGRTLRAGSRCPSAVGVGEAAPSWWPTERFTRSFGNPQARTPAVSEAPPYRLWTVRLGRSAAVFTLLPWASCLPWPPPPSLTSPPPVGVRSPRGVPSCT